MKTSPTPKSAQQTRRANQDYRRVGFEELEDRLKTLMEMLADVLESEGDLTESIPWRGMPVQQPSKTPEDAAAMAQLQAICFEILNMVEERTSLKIRHRRRKDLGMDAEQGMWGRVINQLKAQGVTETEVLEALPDVNVTPVLTAHPTEAKRPTVRERHLAIYKDLVRWDRNKEDPVTLVDVLDSIKADLETLWYTGEIHASRPSISGELRHTIYYLREVFPKVIKKLDVSLESAWEAVGWDVKRLRDSAAYPSLNFGTWVGGDRDGHPLVTADVTANTLARLRKHSLRIYQRELKEAAKVLTHSPCADDVPADLTRRVLELRKELGVCGREIAATNAREPWRCLAYLMREKLEHPDVGYTRVDEYGADLDLMDATLRRIGADTSARNVVHPLRRLVEIFGFHLATLDIRQNSPFHDQAASQMLAIAGVEDAENFADWPEERRVEFLLKELQTERPWRPWTADADTEAGKVMACLQVLREHTKKYGSDCLGLYVVSMTRQVSDMLLVHLFAREGRMADWKDGLWVSRIPVCPLFETGDDLNRGGDVVRSYLSVPSGKHFLRNTPTDVKYMPVMVGYSDSNKDSGLLSGQWSLQKAQAQITTACQDAGARCEFFHGRGGTISRGAGPVQWFLRSLPSGSLSGAMRVTEQGEVIPRKYAHRSNAAYNLELLLAGVTSVTVANKRSQAGSNLGGARYQETMEWLSVESRASYRRLLEEPGFMSFFRQATPIDALERGCFGSRPASRTGTATLDDLRAIPWVFSWTQARYYMPGWFGVGSSLEKLKNDNPDAFVALSSMVHEEPFLRYLLTNVETNLVSADVELMASYAKLVEDEELRARFQGIIEAEFFRTGEMIDQIFGSSFAERRPRMLRTLKMRELPLRLLHEQQVVLLADWRASQKSGDAAKESELLNALQYSVNAIASGLRTTG
ncbi:MAG: phosphoenolpyruvate carboxylase [Verrucomicrobiae bacterium]|nr:phosphoenolpyruvate carboxylase [Verrucomicrobiae bacterium]NNJ44342.1 phosphoenolpyruvate carboxylase [Akkermansiaceae bacterium]